MASFFSDRPVSSRQQQPAAAAGLRRLDGRDPLGLGAVGAAPEPRGAGAGEGEAGAPSGQEGRASWGCGAGVGGKGERRESQRSEDEACHVMTNKEREVRDGYHYHVSLGCFDVHEASWIILHAGQSFASCVFAVLL